jgi:hypothetical protein
MNHEINYFISSFFFKKKKTNKLLYQAQLAIDLGFILPSPHLPNFLNQLGAYSSETRSTIG